MFGCHWRYPIPIKALLINHADYSDLACSCNSRNRPPRIKVQLYQLAAWQHGAHEAVTRLFSDNSGKLIDFHMLRLKSYFLINFYFFYDPSRSELIQPRLVPILVDPVRLLYLPIYKCTSFILTPLCTVGHHFEISSGTRNCGYAKQVVYG